MTVQWDDVVSHIRALPHFSRFLPPPLFSHLQKAAEDGPVIIANTSNHSRDDSIITSVQDTIHVSLNTPRADISESSFGFQPLAEGFGSSDHKLESHEIASILRKSRNNVIGPVVQALRKLVHRTSCFTHLVVSHRRVQSTSSTWSRTTGGRAINCLACTYPLTQSKSRTR